MFPSCWNVDLSASDFSRQNETAVSQDTKLAINEVYGAWRFLVPCRYTNSSAYLIEETFILVPSSLKNDSSLCFSTWQNIKVSSLDMPGIYYHEHKVSMECKALKEAATSVSTHNNLLYNPVLIWETTNQDRIVLRIICHPPAPVWGPFPQWAQIEKRWK